MLLFRSKEHLHRWLEPGTRPSGETMTLERQWELARRWFAGRHRREWRRRTAEEAEALLATVGLVGDFWRLT